jgi:uncharacterized protein (UPF0179 family)
MNIEIRIKVKGKWYKAKKTGRPFEDKCEKCRFKRSCWNGESTAGYEIRQVCEIFDYGFIQIKTTNVEEK